MCGVCPKIEKHTQKRTAMKITVRFCLSKAVSARAYQSFEIHDTFFMVCQHTRVRECFIRKDTDFIAFNIFGEDAHFVEDIGFGLLYLLSKHVYDIHYFRCHFVEPFVYSLESFVCSLESFIYFVESSFLRRKTFLHFLP